MTFKELLDSVSFDDVAEQIVRLYPDMENSLGWYKLHFDMLRLMKPEHHDGANDDVCHITMEDWEDDSGLHLDASPMEGDFWEHSLTKELIIAPDVKATNAELAACCLWHTSFYGFTEKQVSDRFRCYEDWDVDKKGRLIPRIRGEVLAKKKLSVIRRNGGMIPTVKELSPSKKKELTSLAKRYFSYSDTRMNKIKRKRLFRRKFMVYYYKRLIHISDFIINAIPALSREDNYVTIKQLCRLFRSDLIAYTTLESFADEETDSATYLKELIEKYEMLPITDNAIIYIARGYEYDSKEENGITNLRDEESELVETISEKIDDHKTYGIVDVIIDVVPKLGHQTMITFVGYNSDNPITYEVN